MPEQPAVVRRLVLARVVDVDVPNVAGQIGHQPPPARIAGPQEVNRRSRRRRRTGCCSATRTAGPAGWNADSWSAWRSPKFRQPYSSADLTLREEARARIEGAAARVPDSRRCGSARCRNQERHGARTTAPLWRRIEQQRVVRPGQRRIRNRVRRKCQDDRVRLLLAALQLVQIAERLGNSPTSIVEPSTAIAWGKFSQNCGSATVTWASACRRRRWGSRGWRNDYLPPDRSR